MEAADGSGLREEALGDRVGADGDKVCIGSTPDVSKLLPKRSFCFFANLAMD